MSLRVLLLLCLLAGCDHVTPPPVAEQQQAPSSQPAVMDQLLAGEYGVQHILDIEGARFFPPAWVDEYTPTYRLQRFFEESKGRLIVIPADLLDVVMRDGLPVAEFEAPLGWEGVLIHNRALFLRLTLNEQQEQDLSEQLRPPDHYPLIGEKATATNAFDRAVMDKMWDVNNALSYAPQLLLVVRINETKPATRTDTFGEDNETEVTYPQNVIAQGELVRIVKKFREAY